MEVRGSSPFIITAAWLWLDYPLMEDRLLHKPDMKRLPMQVSRIYGELIPCKELAERVASFMHMYTLFEKYRPFGCGVILGGADRDGPQLYVIYPSGSCYRYFAAALGFGKEKAIMNLELSKLSEMTCRKGVMKIATILELARKEKDIDMELSWVCEESNMEYCPVPDSLRADAVEAAKGAGTTISGVESDSTTSLFRNDPSSRVGGTNTNTDISGVNSEGPISQVDAGSSDDVQPI